MPFNGADYGQAVDSVATLGGGIVPLSVMRSCSSRLSAALSVGLSFVCDLAFFAVGSIKMPPFPA